MNHPRKLKGVHHDLKELLKSHVESLEETHTNQCRYSLE